MAEAKQQPKNKIDFEAVEDYSFLNDLSGEELEEYLELEEELFSVDAGENFRDFIRKTKPDYRFNWHHEYLIKRIEAFERGEVKKLMVFMPPQRGKSEIVSRRAPGYFLGKNPNRKISFTTYNATFSSKFNRDVQRIIDDEEYVDIFPMTFLNGKNVRDASKGSYIRNTDEFEIVDQAGSYKSVGVGGPLSGYTVDIGIIDDPIKDAMEANSEKFRERLWDWYLYVFKTRLHKNSQQLITFTRWHEDDLAGRILELEGDEWEVIVFPEKKVDDSNPHDPREIGEYLWPEQHDPEDMKKIEEASPTVWNALYQQNPIAAGGNIIKTDLFIPYTLPMKGAPFFFIDSAYTDKVENDRTAILKFFIRNKRLYIEAAVARRLNFTDFIDFVKLWLPANGYAPGSKVFVEPKASGKPIVDQMKATTKFKFIEDEPPVWGKVTRAIEKTPFIESGGVHYLAQAFADGKYFKELEAFPKGKHDDHVDTLIGAISQINFGKKGFNWTGSSFANSNV